MTDIQPIPNQSPYDRLILIKLYEDKLKELKKEYSSLIESDATKKAPWGKITKSSQSRVTLNGALLHDAIKSKGLDPSDYGQCSIKLTETDVELLVQQGVIDSDIADVCFKETTFETVRITPTKDAREQFELIHNNNTLLLEGGN